MRNNFFLKYRKFLFILVLFSCEYKEEKKSELIDEIEILIVKNQKINEQIGLDLNLNKEKTLKYNYTFLGTLKIDNRNIMVLYKTILSGYKSPQLNNYLVFYDEKYKKIGHYYMQGFDVPVLKENSLTFYSMDSSCKQMKTVHFTTKIPEEIFIPCNNDEGDIINFIKSN